MLADLVVGQSVDARPCAPDSLYMRSSMNLRSSDTRPALLQHVADALANALAGPAQVHFKHLTHVHREGTPSGFSTMSAGVPSAM